MFFNDARSASAARSANDARRANDIRRTSDILTWRLNSQLRHAGLDPASSVLLDFRLYGNDNLRVFICRSNKAKWRGVRELHPSMWI